MVKSTTHHPFLKQCDMGDFKSIKELIDTYYPEIKERMAEKKRNGKRNGK